MRKLSLLILLLIGFSGKSQSIHKEYAATKFPDRVILGWNNNEAATSQSVNWRTDATVTQAVAEISIAEGSPDFARKAIRVNASTEKLDLNGQTTHYHQAHFTALQANTLYAYRVGDGEYWSEWFQFTTAQNTNAPFSFLYFGDAQNDLRSLWSRTIRSAYAKLPTVDFMIHAGDLVNNANYDFQWGEWFEAAGWLNGMVPTLASPGNHEYARKSENSKITLSEHWKPSFVHPQNGPRSLKETAYYMTYQGALLISLDSQMALLDSAVLNEQADWMEEVIKNNPQKWILVFHHHPIYSTKAGRDNDSWRAKMEPIYKKYKVDMVLQGHDHTYGRGLNMPIGTPRKNPDGPIYVVSVSGPKMYDIGLQDWMDRAGSDLQLYQLITIDNNTLSYKAYEATGELYDAFELSKKKSGRNQLNNKIDLPAEKLDLPANQKERFSPEQLNEYETRFQQYMKRKKAQN